MPSTETGSRWIPSSSWSARSDWSVASFAEMLVADDAVGVDEVEGRPVVVAEGAPDFVVVVDDDRIVDPALLDRLPYGFDLVLEGELGRMDTDDEQLVVPVGLRPGTHIRLLAQPVDAGQRPEVNEHDVAAQLGGAEWLRVEPLGRPTKCGHVAVRGARSARTCQRRRAQRCECGDARLPSAS